MPEEQTPQKRNAPSAYTRTVKDTALDVINLHKSNLELGDITLTRGGKEITRPAKWAVMLSTPGRDPVYQSLCNTKTEAISFLLDLEATLKDVVSEEE